LQLLLRLLALGRVAATQKHEVAGLQQLLSRFVADAFVSTGDERVFHKK